MADGAREFCIQPDRRAAFAVFSVAIGDFLGMDLEALKRLRLAAATSTLTGKGELDEVLWFVDGVRRDHSTDARLAAAYAVVAPLIQALELKNAKPLGSNHDASPPVS